MFGRRKTPVQPLPQPPIDSDGKRRVFGEAIFAGEHGEFLRKIGMSPDDPSNIIPSADDFDRQVQESLARQEERRRAIEADLLARHGHNVIRPFFVLAEPVYNGMLGQWLIRVMKLLPYDEWNVVYLPNDAATQAVMGGLPMHPRQSVGPIDELMVKQIGEFYDLHREAKQKTDARVAEVGIQQAMPVIDRYVAYTDQTRERVLAHVAKVRPMIVELIADVQRKAA